MEEIAAVRVRMATGASISSCNGRAWHVNSKSVYRIYCLAGLNLRAKRPKYNQLEKAG